MPVAIALSVIVCVAALLFSARRGLAPKAAEINELLWGESAESVYSTLSAQADTAHYLATLCSGYPELAGYSASVDECVGSLSGAGSTGELKALAGELERSVAVLVGAASEPGALTEGDLDYLDKYSSNFESDSMVLRHTTDDYSRQAGQTRDEFFTGYSGLLASLCGVDAPQLYE